MKKIFFALQVLIPLIFSNGLHAKNTFPLKESWDNLHNWDMQNEIHYQNFDYTNCYITGNSLSGLLSGYKVLDTIPRKAELTN